MGDIINLDDHAKDCRNCKWHGEGVCLRPGGYRMRQVGRGIYRAFECLCFARRKGGKKDENG